MDNRRLWGALRSRWFIVAALALLGILIASVYVLVAPTQFTAEAQLYVSASGSDSASDLAQGGNYAQQQAHDYSTVATKQIVLAPVISTLGLKTTVGKLAERISATVPLNTALITIDVTDTSAARASATSNAVAISLVNAVVKLAPERSDGTTPVSVEVVQRATPPKSPVSPNAKIALLLGLIAGLIVGVIVVILRELATTPVRDVEQAAYATEAPVLGAILQDRESIEHPLVAQQDFGSLRAEQYRQIRTELESLRASTSAFVFTSAVPDEGKSVTAANLAISFAASGRTVCIVDANLRAPVLGGLFGLSSEVGLVDVLSGDIKLDKALQVWSEAEVTVLAAGRHTGSPSETLNSSVAAEVFTTLAKRFDILIIDSPALLPATDAALLADRFGGAVLVARWGKVSSAQLRAAAGMITSRGTPILGVIVNRIPAYSFRSIRHAYGSASRSTSLVGSTASGAK